MAQGTVELFDHADPVVVNARALIWRQFPLPGINSPIQISAKAYPLVVVEPRASAFLNNFTLPGTIND
jgi:hypothetical protein